MYTFEIIRKPVDKLPNGLFETKIADDGIVVYRGSIAVANEAGAKIIRYHLAMRSHAAHNGDDISETRTWNYWVRFERKPKGRHAKAFHGLNRYSWR